MRQVAGVSWRQSYPLGCAGTYNSKILKEGTETMTTQIPNRFQAEYAERTLLKTFSMTGDLMLQVEMNFADNLDYDRMRQAFRLALIAEPILGCRFVHNSQRPYWERIPKVDTAHLQIFEDESQYEEYKHSTIDPQLGPAFNGAILTRDNGDTLLLKIAHAAADAGGAKDVAYLIAELYTKLGQNPDFIPEPNLKGSRSIWQVLRMVPWHAFFKICINYLVETLAVVIPMKSHNPLLEPAEKDDFQYVTRHIPAEQVRKIAEYGKAQQAKLNDLILAAFFRALMQTNWDKTTTLRSAITVDLRRWYLPEGRAEAICNLSGLEIIGLGKHPGANFNDTLDKIVSFTHARKKSWFGLHSYLGIIVFLSWWSYKKVAQFSQAIVKQMIVNKTLFPIFTNLGPIEESRLVFDKQPTSVIVLVPTGFPPFFGLGMSGYKGTLTLSAGTFKSTRTTVENMLDIILAELPS